MTAATGNSPPIGQTLGLGLRSDYRLVDNYRSAASHQALAVAVYALKPDTRQQEVVYKEAISICINMGADRALIEATTGQALSPIEWTGMLLSLLLLSD